jgi:hypothetical protein
MLPIGPPHTLSERQRPTPVLTRDSLIENRGKGEKDKQGKKEIIVLSRFPVYPFPNFLL